MDQITAKLDQIDALHDALVRAYRELAAQAESDGADYEPIRKMAAEAYARVAPTTVRHRRTLAEIRRPKGPIVSLRWTGARADIMHREVIRRTDTRVLIGANVHGDGEWYKLANGYPVERSSSDWLGEWVITDDSLEQIRAMPVGENAVSRALKLAKAKR